MFGFPVPPWRDRKPNCLEYMRWRVAGTSVGP